MGHGGMRAAGVLVALVVLAGGARAQQLRRDYAGRGPAGWVGIDLVGADPISPLDLYFDRGFGAQIFGALPLEATSYLRLRADLGFVIYGDEHRSVCFGGNVGCRIDLDMNTTNSIVYGGLGPEVVLANGPIEPYLYASFGFTYFVTSTSLRGTNDLESFASSTNFSDGMLAWRGGGGLRMRLSSGRTPVSLDVGLERHQNGVAEFLTKGDIIDHPDGSITVLPNRSEANLVTFRMGVSVGIPHKRQQPRYYRR